MIGQGSGAIVNIASVLGVATNPGQVASTTSKAGVIGMVRAMALDLAPHAVHVDCVLPGSTDTSMMRGDLAGARLAEVTREAAAAVPLRRIAALEELARAILFLLSPAASSITGAALAVDSGLLSTIATDDGRRACKVQRSTRQREHRQRPSEYGRQPVHHMMADGCPVSWMCASSPEGAPG